MRHATNAQLPFTLPTRDNARLRELKIIDQVLNDNPKINELVFAELSRGVAANKGAEGLAAEQVLRAFVIKQGENCSYEDLEFHLNDSTSYRWFCRLGWNDSVSKSTLQRDIAKLSDETLEEINRIIVEYAQVRGIENGRKVRVDCTAVETTIHEPTDSRLLWDSVRVLCRLMKEAKELVGDVKYTDHRRSAKKRMYAIVNMRGNKRKEKRRLLYKQLLVTTQKTVGYAEQAVDALNQFGSAAALTIAAKLCHFLELAKKVIDQTRRRILEEQSVPAQEKVVSIFEPHTDIIAKGNRDPTYGHKICLTGGASGLVLDCQILDGNPADATLAVDMIERQQDIYGRPPRQATFDGAFTSAVNLADIKDLGVKDVVFTKARGLAIEDMAKSPWVYRQLRHFRAGIEATISFLKRTFGLTRCTWRGWPAFKSYVWGSIISANLVLVARRIAEQQ